MQLVFELMHLDDVQRLHDEQGVDKKPVALMGRYPTGGSMGAGNETHFLKVCHYVPYRSWA
jgi:hypothetical protein